MDWEGEVDHSVLDFGDVVLSIRLYALIHLLYIGTARSNF